MGRSLISSVKGIIPFYKEAGISCFTVCNWVKLHIAYEYPVDRDWYKPHVECFRNIEPYSSGVVTLGIGRPSLYIKYLKYCDCRYSLTLKMGHSTTTGYYKSKVTDTKPFDHVNLDAISKTCPLFIGTQIQRMPTISFNVPFSLLYGVDLIGDHESYDEPEKKMRLWSFDDEMRHKKRKTVHHRKVTCHSIEVINFDPPYISLEVFCGSTFSIRTFVEDFFTKLNTCGSIHKMERTQEGPFTLDQCIDRTDLYLKYLKPALISHTEPFIDHVRQHLDKTPFYGDKRLNKM